MPSPFSHSARLRPFPALRPDRTEGILLSPSLTPQSGRQRQGVQMRMNLTRFAKSATTGGRRSPIFYDDEVIGFGLQVRDNGRKTFTHLTTPSRGGAGATSSATIRPGASLPPAMKPSV